MMMSNRIILDMVLPSGGCRSCLHADFEHIIQEPLRFYSLFPRCTFMLEIFLFFFLLLVPLLLLFLPLPLFVKPL